MTRPSFVFALLVTLVIAAPLVGPILASEGAASEPQATAPITGVQPAEALAPTADVSVEGAPCTDAESAFDDAVSGWLLNAACCIDRCRRDRDCDAICGAKGAGICIQVNSCCRECSCLLSSGGGIATWHPEVAGSHPSPRPH